MHELIKVINNSKNSSDSNSILSLIIEKIGIILEGNLALYSNPSYDKKNVCETIKTLVAFTYIIFYNIDKAENLILFLTMNSYTLIKILIKAINMFKDNKDHVEVAKFIINICFDDMKQKIYFYHNDKLEEIYQKYVYSEILGIFPSFNEPFNPKNDIFVNFMKNVREMNIDDYIMNLKKENSDIFCKNIIPLLLSTPNFDFISFYSKVVNKHIEIIRKEYNNELTSLFRKDDVTNDLIKNLVLTFCNFSFIKSFYVVIPNEYLSTKEITFNLDSFELFLINFLTKLIESIPYIIKVLLKIIKNCIQKISGEENYSVVYTVLIFNFFISPTVLELYGLSLVKYRSLRQLTRILRNICFGKEFDSNDKLSYFNTKVKIFNDFVNQNFKKYVLDEIDIEKNYYKINNEINSLLVNSKNPSLIINGKSTALPSFCYQYYWKNIVDVINSIKK